MDQADSLAGKDRRDLKIACGPCRGIFQGHFGGALHQLDLTACPAPDMIVDQRSRGERGRPEQAARPVDDDAAHRVIGIGVANALLGFLRAIGLHARIEARADQHAGGAQHHHRREPATIGNSAGGNHRHAPGREIDHRRHDIDGGARCAVAAGFGTLRDQDVRTGVERLLRHVLALHLADQARPARPNARRKWRGIAE